MNVNIEELTELLTNIDDLKEPIVVKRDNKKDLVIISKEEYNYLYSK